MRPRPYCLSLPPRLCPGSPPPQELDLIRLKREAKAKGGFYVEPEAKVVFVVSTCPCGWGALGGGSVGSAMECEPCHVR